MTVNRLLRMALAPLAALGISGCGANVAGLAGDLPSAAPARPAVQAPYPHVYDIPPPRETRLMSESEQARTEAELAANRQKVNAQANTLQNEQSNNR